MTHVSLLINSEPLALLCSCLYCIKRCMSECDCVRRREEFIHWVEMLPDTQTPSWLGLPSNAEKVLLTTQGMSLKRVFTPELSPSLRSFCQFPQAFIIRAHLLGCVR